MNKISLVINSKNPNLDWLYQCIQSAKGFDEVILYLDGEKHYLDDYEGQYLRIIGDGEHRNIGQGLNYAIKHSIGNWVLPFCDDDYFHRENLAEALYNLRMGFYNLDDVVHGQVTLDNGGLWGASCVTLRGLQESNMLPFGSFMTRDLFDRIGGFSETVSAYNDWNFWLRAAKAGAKFKYFPKALYHFRQGHESATVRLLREVGGHSAAIHEVLSNA